jgi:hypothetical protein
MRANHREESQAMRANHREESPMTDAITLLVAERDDELRDNLIGQHPAAGRRLPAQSRQYGGRDALLGPSRPAPAAAGRARTRSLAAATIPTASCRSAGSTTTATTAASSTCCPISSRVTAQSFSTGSATSDCSACCGGSRQLAAHRSLSGSTKANARRTQLACGRRGRRCRSDGVDPPPHRPVHLARARNPFLCPHPGSRAHRGPVQPPVCLRARG